MGYLADVLRDLQTNRDIIFVGTGVIIVDELGRILLGCRTDNNEWCIPGGSLEVGETLEECAVREVREETNVVVEPSNLILNTVKFIQKPINKNGRDIYVVSVSYIASAFDALDLQLDSREFSKYGWLNIKEIKEIFDWVTPYTQEALKVYMSTHENDKT